MHRGFFLPVKAFPPAPNGPGTGGGRCHATYLCGERFNSRPPRGERPAAVHPALAATSFQSTPSARRATAAMNASIKAIELFQSTPSARRATPEKLDEDYRVIFQSTPSARRATAAREHAPCSAANFNPRPPRGGRQEPLDAVRGVTFYFNPRPPRGGRRSIFRPDCKAKRFQSTPSARRATA